MQEPNKEPKKLYRSVKDKMVGGVLAGIGEYFAVDPNIIRLAFVVLLLITGIIPGIIAYIVFYFIMPENTDEFFHISTEPKTAPDNSTRPDIHADTPQDRVDEESVSGSASDSMSDSEEKTEKVSDVSAGKTDSAGQPSPAAPSPTEDEDIPNTMKRPEWPNLSDIPDPVDSLTETEDEPETATLDSLLENDHDVDVDDILDE